MTDDLDEMDKANPPTLEVLAERQRATLRRMRRLEYRLKRLGDAFGTSCPPDMFEGRNDERPRGKPATRTWG
jgi:hypothetical protein